MPRALGLAALVVVCLAALPAGFPQDQAPGIFRGGVTLVNVDAYPRRDGRVVEGLRQADFQIFEDGAPQKIDTFEFIRSEPNTPDADRRDPNTKEEGDELAADPHNRVFVVYLDTYHTTFEASVASRGPLLEFLGHTIGATDLFGVMTPDTSAGQLVFGRRLDTIGSELTTDAGWGLRGRPISPVGRPAIEEQLEQCSRSSLYTGDALVAMYREDVMETGLEQLMARLRDLRDERKNILFVSEGWVPLEPQTGFSALASGALPTAGQGPGGTLTLDPRRGIAQAPSWCDQQIVRLANIDFARRFRDLLTLAARANASFYTVDLGRLRTGLASPQPGVRSIAAGGPDELAQVILTKLARPSTTTLQNLAENTDGRAIVNTNDLGAGLRRIVDDLSEYYLLGYSSTNPALDGKYRRIEVKVSQPGISVAARRGYLAEAPDIRPAAPGSGLAVPAPVADALGRLSRLRADAELFTYGVARDGSLGIVVEISSREAERGQWHTGADVEATVAGARGGDLAARGRIEPGARGALLEIALPAGETGPWRVNLKVSHPEGVLTDRVEVAGGEPPSGALVGTPVVWRGTASSRIPLRPVADFQFRRTERLRVVWPALAALDSRAARVLDRRGDPLPIPATVTDSAGAVDVDVTLAPLAQGDYLIELTAKQGSRAERRLIAFRVVQ